MCFKPLKNLPLSAGIHIIYLSAGIRFFLSAGIYITFYQLKFIFFQIFILSLSPGIHIIFLSAGIHVIFSLAGIHIIFFL